MSLSPVPAISDMVAPMVLITMGTIFANGLLTAGTTLADRESALSQEHLGMLRGPHGELAVRPTDKRRADDQGPTTTTGDQVLHQ